MICSSTTSLHTAELELTQLEDLTRTQMLASGATYFASNTWLIGGELVRCLVWLRPSGPYAAFEVSGWRMSKSAVLELIASNGAAAG